MQVISEELTFLFHMTRSIFEKTANFHADKVFPMFLNSISKVQSHVYVGMPLELLIRWM